MCLIQEKTSITYAETEAGSIILFDTIFNKRIFSAYTLYSGVRGTQETHKIGVLCPV
jgi:hypothetical protein